MLSYFFFLLLSLLALSSADVRTFTITADTRRLVLLQKFGFNQSGSLVIRIKDLSTSVAPFPNPSLIGFFLISDEALRYTSDPSNPIPDFDPNPNGPNCMLYNPYVKTLFTFAELSPPPHSGSFNRTFPIFDNDEYSLFFANCAPQRQRVPFTVSVQTEMYNTLTDGSRT